MKIEKGTKLRVYHPKQGTFDAIATGTFDTEEDEWYPVALDQEEPVYGMTNVWQKGDGIPTRSSTQNPVRVEVRDDASEIRKID